MFDQLHNLFPTFETFPNVTADGKITVLIRLFPRCEHTIDDQDLKVVNIALWSMRSHILNADFAKFKAMPIFHIKQALYPAASEILRSAGVPCDSIISFPDDLCATNIPNATHHWKAAAPILDPQLEKFDHVVVLDGDCFSLKSGTRTSAKSARLITQYISDGPFHHFLRLGMRHPPTG